MKIGAEMDSKSLLLRLRNGEKRLAYATANALRNTALKIQQDEFASTRGRFTIREPGLFFGSAAKPGGVAAKIVKFPNATKGTMYAQIVAGKEAVERMGARQIQGVIYGQFERGGVKLPLRGRPRVGVALTGSGRARSSMAAKLDPNMTWKGMGLTAHVGSKKVKRPGRSKSPERGFGTEGSPVPEFSLEGVRWLGRHGTFMLLKTKKHPLGGVFQRTGSDRGDIRMIWKFQPEVKLDKRLEFFTTAKASWARWYREEFEKQVLASLTHNRFNFVR